MGKGLGAVDWAGLKHNYGSAEDVPGLLHRCAGPDPTDAEEAAGELLNLLFHQGGWICSAAPAALPFLLRLAADPQVPSRRTLLELVAMLATEAGQVTGRFMDPGWAPAWEQVLPEVLALLTDPEPEIRRAAADVVGVCTSPGALLLPGLLRCWRAERDPVTRLDLVLALGQALRREPAGDRSDEVASLLRSLLASPESQLRLAAVHALAADDPGLAARRLDLVLDAVRDPSVELWQRTSSLESGAQGVQGWTAALFTGASTASTAFAASTAFTQGLLADHPDEGQRVGGLAQAGGLLSQWRSPAEALLPAVVARLDDPVTEVRYRATELLACLGPSAAAHADAAGGAAPARPAGRRREMDRGGDGPCRDRVGGQRGT
ncbi:HEAT repeat domain-containing protein [Streptomyces sp. NPDC058632]|uniref:HEAT repeat domain-containing protein n=1 Tax=Streptomyces sp. NPDC058632 TaxID=3346567 RepID=UPI0036494E16